MTTTREAALEAALKRSTEGWANALELGLIPERHRNTAFILRDAGFAALSTPAPSDKIAEAADMDVFGARRVIDAYDAANPFRTADMHPATCHCHRCAIDWLRALAGQGETP